MGNAALARIHDEFETLPRALQRAAQWLSDHPAEVCFLSMREQARRADVVAPTMSRLAQALGYANFRGLQDHFREHAAWGRADFSVRARHMQSRSGRVRAIGPELAHLQASNIEALGALNDPDRFAHVAGQLLKSPMTAFLGFRSCHSVALHAHYLYSMLVGRGVLLQDSYGTLVETIASLPRQSVVVAIGLSPYSRQTVDTVQRAAAQGTAVIALTDSELSPLARAASERLLFEAASPSFFHSLLGAHALVERVMAEIASRGGRAVLRRLAAREALLSETGAYWRRDARRGDR
ncbi:MAG TPA: MurR/RpiR family transcriptional regulator [Casimicrobiaceae bacterium]|jgi:DNA-binding MurR/RpiR family transcriptional regulator